MFDEMKTFPVFEPDEETPDGVSVIDVYKRQVMELPAYHMPTVSNVLRSMWERGWSFIKKAGTVILLSTIFVWFTSSFGFVDGHFGMVEDLSGGILASIGQGIAWIFAPLGWGNWQAAVAAITGLVAKENVVGTFGILYGFAEFAEDGD